MIGKFACVAAVAMVLVGDAAGAPVAPAKDPPPATTGTGDPAAGAAVTPAVASAAPVEAGVSYSHQGQLQASLRLALGMRAIVPYNKSDYCGATDSSTSSGNAPVCTSRAPFSMDLEVGYGVAKRIDLIAELRLGLESDFGSNAVATVAGPRMFHLAPGARFFFSDAKTTKLFTTAQLVLDFAGYKDSSGAGRGADVGARNMNGLWLDLDRAYGIYAYIAETATFSRWVRFELEAGVGFSGRYR